MKDLFAQPQKTFELEEINDEKRKKLALYCFLKHSRTNLSAPFFPFCFVLFIYFLHQTLVVALDCWIFRNW